MQAQVVDADVEQPQQNTGGGAYAEAALQNGHEITSVPLAGVPSARYTTSCTVVVLPAGAWPAILTASSSEIRPQKSRLRRLGLSILVFIQLRTRLGCPVGRVRLTLAHEWKDRYPCDKIAVLRLASAKPPRLAPHDRGKKSKTAG